MSKYKIEINRPECVGDGACCDEAPKTFRMDDEDVAVPIDGDWDDDAVILEAAMNCPTDAIILLDAETGERVHPRD